MIFPIKGVAYRTVIPRTAKATENVRADAHRSAQWLGQFTESPCVSSFELRLLTRILH